LAPTNREIIDPGEGIPSDPMEQLPLLVETDNGVHELDPSQRSVSQEPFINFLFSASLSTPLQYQFLAMAARHIGEGEDSSGRSSFGIWYGDQPKVHNDAFDDAPWCDMFLAKLTYDLLGDIGLRIVGDYALTTAHAAYLHEKGVTSRPSVLEPGSFAFQNWDLNGSGNDHLGLIDHVEIVERDNGDGTATFIGGNVRDAVRRTRRSKDYLVVVAAWWKLLPTVPAPALDDEDMINA
jgi:hypothetical protein